MNFEVTRCVSQICIAPEWRCDGDDDCGDGSDETDAVCRSINCDSERRFRCENFKCIARWRLCDRNDDCGDGSDENNHDLCMYRILFIHLKKLLKHRRYLNSRASIH